MTLGNIRELGVRNLIAYCHNDACRHQAAIDVSSYPPDTPVPGSEHENEDRVKIVFRTARVPWPAGFLSTIATMIPPARRGGSTIDLHRLLAKTIFSWMS